tara:strand:- start:650 stop:1435 length:786 start_codon:yes stop_codon:yes gene_type:complete
MKSGFYGIIPKPILHHPNLKANSKIVYAEIMASLEDDGCCVKRNIYFSKVLNISKDTASRAIAELRNNGFIHVRIELEEGTEKFIKRYITPMQNFLWVNQDENTPYMQNSLGVDVPTRAEDALTYMQNTQTLLYNNNIHKTYTNGNKTNTPINKDISESQAFALTSIVNMFLNKQQSRFPHLYNGESKHDLVNKSINTLYDIIKIDGVEYDVIKSVLEWALDHRFWHSHITSLHTLRREASNGNKRFHNILTDYKTHGGTV